MIRTLVYSRAGVRESAKALPEAGRGKRLWLQVTEPTKEEMDGLGARFGLHQLILEDCLNTVERPKIEYFDDYLFVVVKEIRYRELEIHTNQIAVILGKNFVITVSQKKSKHLKNVENRLARRGGIKNRSVDFLMHAVIDSVVDDYLTVLDKLEDIVSELEDKAIESPGTEIFMQLNDIKRALTHIKKTVWPTREVLLKITHILTKFITPGSVKYFRDIYDHITTVADMTEANRDLVAGTRDLCLSSTSNAMNEVMKKLTVVATIMMPLTLITGIYGMNFKNLPEIYWELGYPFTLLLMLIIGIGMLFYLERKGWT